jgi:hypothetical protein
MEQALTRRIAGRVAYWGAGKTSIGHETFEIAEHAGGRTVRALCEMDDIGLLRDVTIALTPDWKPLDAFCRITKPGRVASTTWFNLTDDALIMEGNVEGIGRISQRLPNSPRFTYIGLHPLQGDALVTTQVDQSRPGEFMTIHSVTNSISPNGDIGLHAMPVDIDVAFIGEEEIEVAAGRFTAWRYALRWSTEWPPADVWVRQGDYVFLKMTWSMIENWYELTALEES